MANRGELKVIARMMTGFMAIQGIEIDYEEQRVARDLGAGIYHNTIIANTKRGSFQIFSPREVDCLADGTLKVRDIVNILEKHIETCA